MRSLEQMRAAVVADSRQRTYAMFGRYECSFGQENAAFGQEMASPLATK
jgi:hypothetical protein